MLKKRSTKLMCLLIAFLWTTVIIGSSYAYFIDSVSVTGNVITSGNLKAALSWKNPGDAAWKDASEGAIFNYQRWEPGYTDVKYIKVENTGSLAFQYELNVYPAELLTGHANLLEVIDVYYGEGVTGVTRANYAAELTRVGTLMDLLTNANGAAYGILLPAEGKGSKDAELPAGVTASTGSVEACMVLHMQEEAGNEYMGLSVGDGFKVQLYATQYMYEKDSFGNTYDEGAASELPVLNVPTSMIIDVQPVNGLVPYDVWFNDPVNGVSATVPQGAKMADGATSLKLVVEAKENSDAKVNVTADEELFAYNVKVEGLAADNTVPVVINMGEVLPNGLNLGNYSLYHVENGVTTPMTLVDSAAALDAHNEFTYNPVNGEVAVAMATFSEVAGVVDTAKAWEGNFDYDWYDASKTELTIANADQLAAFGAIVGGMNGQTQDSFSGKIVKLVADVNLGDKESENKTNLLFYPIGYYNSEGTYERTSEDAITSGFKNFEGTFDGNGHTIGNFYQNTWEMKGDNSYYDATLQYYRDGMGLFGKVYGGTVKNLTVDHFSSDGEYTTTGVIAAYADGATFENIAITNCTPRVYNIGNGGIVGCVGWYAEKAGLKSTFTNITVDNSNKISALWGSWDVACGGLVGQYYPTSGQTSAGSPDNAGIEFVNCHVAAQIDVYNDVCANYQYYWYRYSGMMIGSIRKNVTVDGYTYPDMTNITASGCTVHFGSWNDYFYCELVDNSIASYTHDYQFSRLEQVDTLPESAEGTKHYIKVTRDADGNVTNKECRHFIDGVLHTHDMSGTETVNGESVAVENNVCVELPFDQLFTGYGWGVKSKGLKDVEDNADLDITILDREVPDSWVKFAKADTAKDSYTFGTTVSIGELFKAATIRDTKLSIKGDKVQVFVSPVSTDSEKSTAGATYTANSDWTQGTLTFYGKGAATITITDYYYCTPTTINVEIIGSSFLYRVGNQNMVTENQIAMLLTRTDSFSSISIDNHKGDVAWSKNDSNIEFTGTGIVTVTIDNVPYYLEVVDAENATNKSDATDKNIVLLNDISGSFTVSNGYAVYGNGFKATCSGNGSYKSAAVSYGFVTVENGGILDNVQVICDIFPESYLYTGEMAAGSDGRYPYGYSAVVVSGNSTISNCYIYGARNNIQVGEGNVTIENTVTECGSLSNIHIKSNDSYTVTLDNVTTIQYQTTSSYDTSKKVLGFGILVGTNESASNAKLHLTGDLKQYNWVTSDDTSVSNTYAKTAITEALKKTDYQHTINNFTTVNMGIVYLNTLNADITDERSNYDSIPYELNEITMSGQTGQVYSISGSGITADSRYDAETDGVIPYSPEKNRQILPKVVLNSSGDGVTFEREYKDAWLNKLTVDLANIEGDSYTFKFNDLTVQKYDGVELNFTVKDADGGTVELTEEITLAKLETQNYTLSVTDDQIYGADGNKADDKITHELPFVLYVTTTKIDPPEFTNAGTATAIRLVESKGGDWRPAYTVLTGVSVTYWSASESKEKTVDLSNLYNSGTISSNVWTYTCDDYTLTITGGAVHSDGTTITPVVANDTLYFASTNKAFGTGTTSRNIVLTYVFTDKNASTTWNRTETVTYSELSEYDYNSFKNKGTLTEPSSGCVTPDTLVTLANGSQVRVDSLSGNEKLLVWNMETGMLDAAPIMFVDSDPEAEYEVVHLHFSDGTDVKVIYEHGFWDYDLNKYVYLDKDAAQYIGHTFAKQNGDELSKVKLTDVVIEKANTTAWSPVTADHLCYFVNGMLSMPGGVGGLFNIFDVEPDTMSYDMEALARDIETYGLFTYEELNAIVELPEEMFNAAGGAYLKVSIGKGNLTMDELIYLIERYKPYF